MANNNTFDVIIVGGSYAGLSAAMALGRSLRSVLIIDSGKPCNRQTPHSHNFLTQDGKTPLEISNIAKEQVLQYNTVIFKQGRATTGRKIQNGFEIQTQSGDVYISKKIIFATGLKDIPPNIEGYSECWGISIIHCPYCHGYEVKNKKTGIMANGDIANHYAPLIANLTKDLILITNGKSTLTEEQTNKIRKNNIKIIEKKINRIKHENGKMQQVVFEDESTIQIDALYSSPDAIQHSDIPEKLGCQFTEEGLIKVDDFQQTTINGVYACGDNSNKRAVSLAVSNGSISGVHINNSLALEDFG
ncbi:NAD(P)/FAD-dependent oxidoreductase [Aquimarina sediminis]|uniref:NAD(P)/FAD-dependent oxidoreductase n=1 Tax=Aquimarina sediminis TaxID=2070536 RepID=UPI000CA070E8|nr:NAD(P)/FAD-dependent oxidoreductase [Aquimarina sediminis]